MADLAPSFPTLEDIDAGNAGVALSQAVEGDTITGRNFAGMLPAKDPSDQLAFLQVDANGDLKTTQGQTDLAELDNTGSATDVSTETKVVAITLQASTSYKALEVQFSSYRDMLGRVVYVEDVGVTDVETEIMAGLRIGSGQYDFHEAFLSIGDFTTGATGVHELQLLVTARSSASDVDGTLGIKEVQ